MRPRRRLFLKLLCLTLLTLTGASGWLFGQRFNRQVAQNDPPKTEVVIARWRYTAMGKYRGTGWSHNYPSSDSHFAQVLGESTLIDVNARSYRIVDLGSPEVFSYPFAVVSEPGELALTPEEVENLRQYIDRGGFVLMDDFDGEPDLSVIRRTLKLALPDRELETLSLEDPVFQNFFSIDRLNVVAPYVVGGDPIFYALRNSKGKIGLIAAYNNDLENFWDYIDDGRYPLKPSVEGFRLGINFIIYALSH